MLPVEAVPKTTTAIEADFSLPVTTLRVIVLEGPDTGRDAIGETLTIGTAEGNDLVLSDPTVSRYHAEFTKHPKGVSVIDHQSTNGVIVGTARLDRGIVQSGSRMRLGRTLLRVEDSGNATVPIHSEESLGDLRGRSSAMRRLMAQISRAAQSSSSVLLVGESGTGKELIARAIHHLSTRAERPFQVVDCGALAPNLVASELFGHERGAFTGADRRHLGAFERSNGGTLFLDEIGELPSDLQPMLLGVLERKRFRRVGGTEEIATDVRVVSATHRDLRAAINTSMFRMDLYYRLAVVNLTVPPLRERADDIPLLVSHFLKECGHTGAVEPIFPVSTMERLMRHPWPGNVRELRNLVEATLAMGEAPNLEHTIEDANRLAASDPNLISVRHLLDLPYKDARAGVLHAFERRYLARLLEEHGGNVTHAAKVAGMDRSYLSSLVKRHNLRSDN